MKRDLLRAILQLIAEIHIYAWERILEQLNAERPMHDEPMPDDVVPNDFSGYSLQPQGGDLNV